MTVTRRRRVVGTTQDFSAPISQILSGKPDVVSILLVGALQPDGDEAAAPGGLHRRRARQLGCQRRQPHAGRCRMAPAWSGRRLPLTRDSAVEPEVRQGLHGGVRRAPAQLRGRGLRRGLVPGQRRSSRPAADRGGDQGRAGRRGQGEASTGALGDAAFDVAGPHLQVPGVVVPVERHQRGILYEGTGS